MSNDKIKFMMRVLGEQIFEKATDPSGTVAVLITETIKFRDKLKESTGEILTVEDTRVALEGLEEYIKSDVLPKSLSMEQKSLAQIWIDRLTIFQKHP